MKKRPSFKVAAIESLETRELLSTTSFRPLQLRAAHSSAAAANQAVSVGSGTAGAALRAQGGPSATFNAQRYANLVAARAAHSQALHIARPNAARRNALQAPTLATTPAPVSSNPTKLAPSLPFTSSSSGTTTAGHPFVMNPGATSYRPSTSRSPAPPWLRAPPPARPQPPRPPRRQRSRPIPCRATRSPWTTLGAAIPAGPTRASITSPLPH